jgi:hypothetical protein
MKRKFFTALALLCVGMLSGCHFDGKLYPVQGPLASQQPPAAFPIRFIAGFSKSGEISATLANGEVLNGKWMKTTEAAANGTTNSGNANTSANLSAAWDAIFGGGYYAAHVLGRRDVIRGTLTGNHGTTLTVEAYQSTQSQAPNAAAAGVRGVAADSNGNVYKLTF